MNDFCHAAKLIMSHVFQTPKQIIYGENALKNAKKSLSECGSKALIVTDETMIKLGNINLLTDILKENGQDYEVFSKINAEPDTLMIEEGKNLYRKQHCNFLIALGGGAVMDSAKAIAVKDALDDELAALVGKEITVPLAPLAAIATTAGTGSEATRFTIITDPKTQVKMLLKGTSLIPSVAVIDPAFSKSTPQSVTAATGIDALCHALEAFISIHAQPLSDSFALSAINSILNFLSIAYNEPDNMEARTQMSLAALEAGIAFNNSSVTLIHGMSRPIGALFHVPHGLSNAMLLEKSMNFMFNNITVKLAQIARTCRISENSSDELAANELMQKITDLLQNLHIPSMSQFGIEKTAYFEAVPKMARDAFSSGSINNAPMSIQISEVENLYRSVYF